MASMPIPAEGHEKRFHSALHGRAAQGHGTEEGDSNFAAAKPFDQCVMVGVEFELPGETCRFFEVGDERVSSPVATAEFSKFAGILNAALSQHSCSSSRARASTASST